MYLSCINYFDNKIIDLIKIFKVIINTKLESFKKIRSFIK